MRFTLLCGGPWRRRRPGRGADGASRRESRPQSTREAEVKKRETLHKKIPAVPARRDRTSISTVPHEGNPTTVELDAEPTLRSSAGTPCNREVDEDTPGGSNTQQTPDPPADCAELPADPPNAGLLNPTESGASSTWIKQRSASLPGCPLFLVPGSAHVGAQAQPRGDSKSSAVVSTEKSLGSGCGWGSDLLESSLADWQSATPTSPASPLSTSSYTGRSGSALTLSPLTSSTPAHSHANLPATAAATPDAITNPHILQSSEGDISKNSTIVSRRRPSLAELVPTRSLLAQPRLSARQSNSNMDHLLARHSVLESRRQILLQLHEVEQEQERILEELAAMPEEDVTSSPPKD